MRFELWNENRPAPDVLIGRGEIPPMSRPELEQLRLLTPGPNSTRSSQARHAFRPVRRARATRTVRLQRLARPQGLLNVAVLLAAGRCAPATFRPASRGASSAARLRRRRRRRRSARRWTARPRRGSRRSSRPRRPARRSRRCAKYDTSGDGMLDKKELTQLIRKDLKVRSRDVSDAEHASLVAALDDDGGGTPRSTSSPTSSSAARRRSSRPVARRRRRGRRRAARGRRGCQGADAAGKSDAAAAGPALGPRAPS